MQGGDEHGALHREFEDAVLQQITQNIGDAESFPYLAEQQWPADALLPLGQGLDLRVLFLQPYVDGPLLASCWAVL
jgi:hypothetical protein